MTERYAFGAFTVDLASRKLWRDDQELSLPSRAFDALAHLLRHRDRPVSKDELIKAVWAGAFVSDDSLVHCVSVIRRALQDDVEHPRFVATLPRRGYQFVWPEVESLGPEGDAPHDTVSLRAENAVSRRDIRRWWQAGLMAASVLVLLLGGRALLAPADSVPDSGSAVLLAQLPPPGTALASGGILSPDGRYVAFVARDQENGTNRLWVRSLDAADARPIAGTEGAAKPFWSPDSQSIGYFSGETLRTVGLVGESIRTIARLSVSGSGGTWSPGGVIVFGDVGRGLFAVGASGGSPVQITALDAGQDANHAWPHFLPDGHRFLYTISSWNAERTGIWAASVDGADAPRRIAAAGSPAVYALQGHLVYVDGDALVAAPFDAASLSVTGEPVALVRNVLAPRLPDGDVFSMAGPLLSYRGGSRVEQLVWYARDGSRLEAIEGPTALYNPMLSPDGAQLVATGSPARDPGLWLVDLRGHASTRLAADGIGPLWSPDGQQIAFTSRGGLDINLTATVGAVRDTVLLSDAERKVVHDWSPDGRHIVYSRMNSETHMDLWLLPVGEPQKSTPLLATAANERGGRISPDGRWIAYASDESGQSEIYVQQFPGLGSKRAVSTGGGAAPFWRQDGRELYYLTPDRVLMAVDVRAEDTIAIGRPRALFRAPVAGDVSEARNHYLAARDGQSFLVSVMEESPDRAAISVVVNWLAQLQ